MRATRDGARRETRTEVLAADEAFNSDSVQTSHNAIARAIARMEVLPIHDLRTEWRRVFRRRPAPGLTKWLLVRMLVHQLQVDAFGDLDPKTQRMIDRLVAKLTSGPFEGPLVTPLPMNTLQCGTVLVREWNGRMEHVMVAEGGFVWNGETWRSLSEVARRITGTQWNGWTFFGLKKVVRPAADDAGGGKVGRAAADAETKRAGMPERLPLHGRQSGQSNPPPADAPLLRGRPKISQAGTAAHPVSSIACAEAPP